jgi:hypothetical protein
MSAFPAYEKSSTDDYESYMGHAHFDTKGRFKGAGLLNSNEKYGVLFSRFAVR